MQSSHSHIARISRRITPTPGHDHRFSGMLFFPSLFRSRSAIRSRDLPPISPRCARDTNLRLVAQHRVNPVRDPAGAAHVLALHARRRRARLLLPGLVGRRDHQAPAPPARRAAASSPAAANRRTSSPPRPATPGSAAAASGPVTGPRHARPSSARSASAARWPAQKRTSRAAATSASARSSPAARPPAQPVSGPPARPLSWQQQPPPVHLSCQAHDRQAAALTS